MAERRANVSAVRALVPRLTTAHRSTTGRSTAGEVISWLGSVCDVATHALPASGVGVSLMTSAGALGVAASSDEVTHSLGRLQVSLGEGPCIDAFEGHRPVLEPDLTAVPASRWPGYAPGATALGAYAVFSFPLQVGAAGLGAMDVYRTTTGSLSPEALGLALGFADVVVETLLGVQDGLGRRRDDGDGTDGPDGLEGLDGLGEVLDPHYVVYQAQGMTMVDLGVPLADALARLRAHAFAEGRPLHEVAQDVVDGRLRLEADAP